jgi:chemotaxis protein methyltransferase CheR
MLDRCRSGRYSQIEVNRGLPASLLVRYFERDGMSFVFSEDLRRRFRFEPLNLASPWSWRWPMQFDLVFLRNVLIYFDVETKRQILGATRRHLHDDGTLLLGAAETVINLTDEFAPVQVGQSTFYRPT